MTGYTDKHEEYTNKNGVTSVVYLMDCMKAMEQMGDKEFALACVDPPYGLGIDGQKLNNTNKNRKHNRRKHDFKGWDSGIPSRDYFERLIRVSHNQIIWGGNYFTEYLNPTKAWVFWYKGHNDLTMSDGELAWTSFQTVTRQIEINRFEIKRDGPMHPTQKPTALYDWIFKNYAKPNDTIFDSHLGSGSSRIAADRANLPFTGVELDPDYFRDHCKRFDRYTSQLTIF